MAYYAEGLYECIVQNQGFGESREKRTPCFWLRFVPVKHDSDHIDQQYEREIKLWLTDNTIDQVVSRLRAMGWTGDTFKELEPGRHSFEGINIQLRCFHSEVNGKVYENWEFPPPRTASSENNSTVAKRVDALFGKALRTKKGTAPVDAQTTTTDQDDCPF